MNEATWWKSELVQEIVHGTRTVFKERWLRLFGQFPADFKWISAGVY
jgi:hypothetical protein